MNITPIGVGSAFNTEQLQSNALITTADGSRLLIDAGSTAKAGLEALQMSHRDLDAVFIGHLHADHIGGLEWLGFGTHFDLQYRKTKNQLKLFIRRSMIAPLWQSLKAGLVAEDLESRLQSWFDVHPIAANGKFRFGGNTFFPVQTLHFVSDREIMPSYGLIFDAPCGTVFFTGDTVLTPHLMAFYKRADLIFQDCETQKFSTGVHAHFNQLVTLPAEIKSKMVLYHFSQGDKPDAVESGFRGWAMGGQTFDLSAPVLQRA